jgi:hypothetical protein
VTPYAQGMAKKLILLVILGALIAVGVRKATS